MKTRAVTISTIATILPVFAVSEDECNEADHDYRNFFVFDLGTVSGTILGAQLQLAVPGSDGYFSSFPSLKYGNYDVSTALPALTGGTGGASAYADLGGGVLFAATSITNDDEGTTALINLNGAGVASIQESLGGNWAIGGRADVEAVPEPGTLSLAGLAIASLVWARRRIQP
jgi:hypothetical protein